MSHKNKPTDKACWREAERSDWTTKNGGKRQHEVSKKSCLFISSFVGLLHKLKKMQNTFTFLNKLAVFFLRSSLSEYFLCETLENPWFCALYPGKLWNFHNTNPGKSSKIPWKTLENRKIWAENLIGNPATLQQPLYVYQLEVLAIRFLNLLNIFHHNASNIPHGQIYLSQCLVYLLNNKNYNTCFQIITFLQAIYSPNIRLQNDKFLWQCFKKIVEPG